MGTALKYGTVISARFGGWSGLQAGSGAGHCSSYLEEKNFNTSKPTTIITPNHVIGACSATSGNRCTIDLLLLLYAKILDNDEVHLILSLGSAAARRISSSTIPAPPRLRRAGWAARMKYTSLNRRAERVKRCQSR
jgi:hypothetical protein